MKSLLPILLLLSITIKGQSINVETERFESTKALLIKSYNGCCAKKGFRAIYTFDNKGRAIECKNYFKRQLRSKFKYTYNEAGLLAEEIQVYSINNRNRIDSTHYTYHYDNEGKIQSKKMIYGSNLFSWTYTYKDFDEYGFPKTIISEDDRHNKNLQLRDYDTLGNILFIKIIKGDTLYSKEVRKYDSNGNIVYSEYLLLPKSIERDTSGLALFIGGTRISRIENYEYTYDNSNRWKEKYVIYDDKRILFEKRKYK